MPLALQRTGQLATQTRDALLVKAVLAGDARSFERLMILYKKRVAALGMSFFKNESDTDDFVQDVFIKAYRSLSTFKGEAMFSTWLTRIAYNMAINAVSRRKEYLPLSAEEQLASRALSPEEEQIQRTTAESVREAIRNLPERYAVCVEMYFFYDIPYHNIEEITGIPENTIKSHIFRAKKILREKLKELNENE